MEFISIEHGHGGNIGVCVHSLTDTLQRNDQPDSCYAYSLTGVGYPDCPTPLVLHPGANAAYVSTGVNGWQRRTRQLPDPPTANGVFDVPSLVFHRSSITLNPPTSCFCDGGAFVPLSSKPTSDRVICS